MHNGGLPVHKPLLLHVRETVASVTVYSEQHWYVITSSGIYTEAIGVYNPFNSWSGTGQLITEIKIDIILPTRYGFEKLITDNWNECLPFAYTLIHLGFLLGLCFSSF